MPVMGPKGPWVERIGVATAFLEMGARNAKKGDRPISIEIPGVGEEKDRFAGLENGCEKSASYRNGSGEENKKDPIFLLKT